MLASSFALTGNAVAVTRSYPGPAPCDSTLQACIDGADSGDRIEIGTQSQVAEDLSIDKSLTLAAASGVSAAIGGERVPRALDPRQIEVREAPSGGPTTVVFSGLTLTADVYVKFATGSGHAFSMRGCSLVRYEEGAAASLAQYPGSSLLDLTDNAGLSVEVDVPASVEVSDSTFIAGAGNVVLIARVADDGPVQFDVLRNRFIGAQCCRGEFTSTVYVEPENGLFSANIADNLFHRWTAGAPSYAIGVYLFDATAAPSGAIYVTGNTIDDAPQPGNTWEVQGAPSSYVYPEGSSTGLDLDWAPLEMIHLYDNVFSNLGTDIHFTGLNTPLDLSAVDAVNNDFFDVGFENWLLLRRPELQLSVDPGFVSLGRDFHLQSGSALIDQGSSPPSGLLATDIDGNPRVVGAAVDLGAFEYAPMGEAGASGTGGSAGEAGAADGGVPGADAGSSVSGAGAGAAVGGTNAGGTAGSGAGGTAGSSGGGSAGIAGAGLAGRNGIAGNAAPDASAPESSAGDKAGTPAQPAERDTAGCGCRLSGYSPRVPWSALLLAAALVAVRRRSR